MMMTEAVEEVERDEVASRVVVLDAGDGSGQGHAALSQLPMHLQTY